MTAQLCAVILAAGEGKRMKSDLPKVLSKVLSKPMLQWVIDAAESAGIQDICVVDGFKRELVEEYLSALPGRYHTAYQKERKGTAHAVMQAAEFLKQRPGAQVLVLNGDAPFLDSDTIRASLACHQKEQNAVTLITAIVDDPYGYGRAVREEATGRLKAVIEEKDADAAVKAIREINSGAYWFRVDALLSVLPLIGNDNAQGEYYLPDTVKYLIAEGENAGAFAAASPDAVLGANDAEQLMELNRIAAEKGFC